MFGLLWAIPNWIVSRRPGYLALQVVVESDRGYQQALHGKLEVDRFPERFELEGEVERYIVIARGAEGVIRVEGEVRAGKVVHQQSLGLANWQAAWRERKQRWR